MSRMGGGIKPVGKQPSGGGAIAGRRAAPSGGAEVRPGRGLSKGKSVPALAPAREPAISAAHLLSLLGNGGGAGGAAQDLRGLFAAQEGRGTPIQSHDYHAHRGRRRSAGEDIITGLRKVVPQQDGGHDQRQGQQQQQQQPTYWPQQQQQAAPVHNSYEAPRNHPSMQSPEWQQGPVSSSAIPGNSSPVAKNRARAMGSTIFMAPTEADLSSTITGNFRGRVPSAAPQPQPRNDYGAPPQQQQPQQQSYISNSSMLNKEPSRRPQPVPQQQQQQQQYGHGGAYDEQKSNYPPMPTRDPYARQQQHQNPYDTRDPSIYTQRGQGLPPHHQRPPPTGRDGYSPPRSPHRGPMQPPQQYDYNQTQQQPYDDYGNNGGGAYDTYRGPSSPPRSPSHMPRASWGGGDVSQFEAGSVGHRDEARRKRDEMRAILDAQIRDKQAMGGGGGAGGAKSTKYALRHRERQAELLLEQQKAGGHRVDSPTHAQQQQHYQQQPQVFNYNQPPQQQQQYPPQQQQYPPPSQYGGGPSYPPPSHDLLSPSSSGPHARMRSDLHAGAIEAADGLDAKMRAQLEFRAHLEQQVAEKAAKKAAEKAEKDDDDRRERIRMGIDPLPQHQQQQQQQQQPQQHYSPQQQHQHPQFYQQQGQQPPQQQYNPHQQFNPHQQQQQQYPPQLQQGQGQQQSYPPPLSPSAVAENRGRQMTSQIFSGEGGLTEAEKKARERSQAQQELFEQVEARKQAKLALEAQEAEMERRDNSRIARERLEMLARFQGMDPQAAAQNAQHILAEAAKNASPQQPQNLQQLQISQQQHNSPQPLLSPSNAKTQVASFAPQNGQQQQQQQYPPQHPPQQQQFQQPEFDYDFHPGAHDPEEQEENIAKLTALTSAMNMKVENRRAAAQQFEDSGLIDEGDPRAHKHHAQVNLDAYEEVPRKVSGVTVAGRRGGKQGPSNKKRPPVPQASGKGHGQPRQKSTSRSRRSHREDPDSHRAAPSKKKPSAAQREREREAELAAAASKRRASILARARREADEDDYDDPASGRSRSRRSQQPEKKAPSRSQKAGLGAGRERSRERDTRRSAGGASGARAKSSSRPKRVASPSVSAMSVSRYSRDGGGEDDDLEVEVQQYTEDDESARRYSPSRGSRIPHPRVQSGKKRRVAASAHPHPDASRSHSRYASPTRDEAARGHHYRASDLTGYGQHGHAHPRSPHRYPPASGADGGHAVHVNDYPWFAQAAAAHSALDASLSGNSAFILLPSSSAHVLPGGAAHGGDSEYGSVSSSRAPSSLQYDASTADDGILPDELEKLMKLYGHTVGLDNVFDAQIVPSTPAQPTSSGSPRKTARGIPASSRQGSAAQGGPTRGSTARSARQQPPPALSTNQTPRPRAGSIDGGHGGVDEGGPLSPGVEGESLEAGSQEWLAGSAIMSPSNGGGGGTAAGPPQSLSRAMSPVGMHHPGLTQSNSRSSLGGVRPVPRVRDPFSNLSP